jgi:hypothetical protein
MLTRHFYESEEVELALSFAIVRGRHQEAAFWCEELLCSKESSRAWGALYRTWLEQCLVVVPDWADTWLSTDTDIHAACAELCDACRLRRDISVPLLLLMKREDAPPERLRETGGTVYSDSLVHYFYRACSQGKAHAAWWAAQALGHRLADLPLPAAGPRLFSYLSTLVLPGGADNWRAATMCAAVVLQCLEGLGKATGLCGPFVRGVVRPVTDIVLAWRALEGRRARRLFSIPRECLLCVTPRGRSTVGDSTMPLLYTVQDRILKGEGCAYWNSILPCAPPFIDKEDALEAFYEKAFPDDIPDEWSKEAQLQSHGSGVLSRTEESRWSKWARLWLDADALFAWGVPPLSLLPILTPPSSATAHWLDCLFLQKGEIDSVDSLLAPVRKMKIVE